MARDVCTGWAMEEFSNVHLGDKRLDSRLIKLCDALSESPESPINQACEDWSETKAAYRCFQNETVDAGQIMGAHTAKTSARMKGQKTILAIQDTTYIMYTDHTETTGLGNLSVKKGKRIERIYSKGLLMHSCLAVTTEGLPLGLLDQRIASRAEIHKKPKGERDKDPIEGKESFRWLKTLGASKTLADGTQIVTVCDREADMYEFFLLSIQDRCASVGTCMLRSCSKQTINVYERSCC